MNENEKTVNNTLFRQIVGSLRFVCNSIPDISFGVGLVSIFMETPKLSHLITAKRILRYLKGTSNFGILFPRNQKLMQSEHMLLGYSDLDWSGDKVEGKSTLGYLFKFLGVSVSWCSKKQPVVALLSCEAEYIAACYAACQAFWLRNMLKDLHICVKQPLKLLVDNKSTINFAKNPIAHGRSKHIETRFHFLRDQVNNGKLKLEFCPSKLQKADIFTKGLGLERFNILREMLNVIAF
jgi:hypothetical protein